MKKDELLPTSPVLTRLRSCFDSFFFPRTCCKNRAFFFLLRLPFSSNRVAASSSKGFRFSKLIVLFTSEKESDFLFFYTVLGCWLRFGFFSLFSSSAPRLTRLRFGFSFNLRRIHNYQPRDSDSDFCFKVSAFRDKDISSSLTVFISIKRR